MLLYLYKIECNPFLVIKSYLKYVANFINSSLGEIPNYFVFHERAYWFIEEKKLPQQFLNFEN